MAQPPNYPPQPPNYPPQPPHYPPPYGQQGAFPPPPGYPPPYGGPPVPPRAPRSAARWLVPLLVGGGLVLVLVIGCGFVAFNRLGGDDRKPGTTAGGRKLPDVDRPGYKDLAESIVDPEPLVEKVDTPPLTVGNAPVIPACSLLPLADLKKSGVLLNPNPLKGSYTRSFFDNQGTGRIEPDSDYSLPLSPPNSCQYAVFGKGLVTVETFQESYNKVAAINYEVKDYEEQPAIGSVAVRRRKPSTGARTSDDEHATYALRLGPAMVRMSLLFPKGTLETVQPKLLAAVATNLQARSAKPVGNPVVEFSSPAYTAKPLNACTIFTAEDYKALFNVAPAPFAEEELATAVGRLNFSIDTTVKDSDEYAYLETGCRRFTGERSITSRVSLRVEVRSYESDKAARYDLATAGPYDKAKPTSRTVGDESYCVTFDYARSAGTLVFRKGRFHVTISLVDPKEPKSKVDPGARAERLIPVAERILARLGT